MLIGVVPFAAAFGYALLYSVGLVGTLSEGFTLRHWKSVWESGRLLSSFGYSAAIAAVSMVFSVGLALWLTLDFKKYFDKNFLSFMIYLPLAIPGVVAGFFTLQILSKSGFLSRISFQTGWIEDIRQFPDLVNDQFAIGIIITFVALVMPFFVLLFLNIYKNERLEALSRLAHSLGASRRQVQWRVSIPILLRKTWTLIVLYFLFLLGAYEIPLILGQQSPQMLSVLIIREINQYDLVNIPEGYVLAVVYTAVVIVAVSILFSIKKTAAHEV